MKDVKRRQTRLQMTPLDCFSQRLETADAADQRKGSTPNIHLSSAPIMRALVRPMAPWGSEEEVMNTTSSTLLARRLVP